MTKQKPHQNLSQPRDGGYTIIESLVAMIVVSVLMIAIAPVMAFSVATRVQARRVELATQAARTYIDTLRSGAIASPTQTYDPSNSIIPPAPADKTNLYCFKSEQTSEVCGSDKDFYVQGIRSLGAKPTDTGYFLKVRVYRADAPFGSLITQEQGKQQSVANSGLGNPKLPLVVMQTEIPPTTTGNSSAYRSLCDRTGGCN